MKPRNAILKSLKESRQYLAAKSVEKGLTNDEETKASLIEEYIDDIEKTIFEEKNS